MTNKEKLLDFFKVAKTDEAKYRIVDFLRILRLWKRVLL